ncbi:MAG TPA: TRAM domain-containing protein [Coriobacteriia bacterium]|nr:TRAM domain-containing protein [Coriobacteriia bacterium]
MGYDVSVASKKGHRMRVLVGPLTSEGEATALLPDGRVALVSGGCPGDVAEIDLVHPSGRRPHARILSLLEPSPDRVDAPCPYFAECSGCQWQHVSPSAQLEAKTRLVAEALADVPGLEAPLLPTVASPLSYGYRNELTLTADESSGATHLGIASADGHSLVSVERCLLLPEPFRGVPRRLAGALRFLSGRHGPLGVRHVSLRVSPGTRDVEIALWTDPGAFPRRIAGKTLADAVGATSVVRVLFRSADASRRVVGFEVLAGRGVWSEAVWRRTFVVSAPSPFPANTSAAALLVDAVVAGLAPGPDDRVLDARAGAGFVTARLPERCERVVALEACRFSLANLRGNLENAGPGVEVVAGDPAHELPALGRFDLLVVSPPATGLPDATVAALAGTGARALAHIARTPASLARDAARLRDASFRITRVEPYDLYPQTANVDTLAIFERDKP